MQIAPGKGQWKMEERAWQEKFEGFSVLLYGRVTVHPCDANTAFMACRYEQMYLGPGCISWYAELSRVCSGRRGLSTPRVLLPSRTVKPYWLREPPTLHAYMGDGFQSNILNRAAMHRRPTYSSGWHYLFS